MNATKHSINAVLVVGEVLRTVRREFHVNGLVYFV